MPTPELIKSNMRVELEAAQAIYGLAIEEKREPTPAETARVAKHLDRYEDLKGELKDEGNQRQVRAALDALRGEHRPSDASFDENGRKASPDLELPPGLGIKAASVARWSEKASEIVRTTLGRPGSEKALISGSVDVPALLGEVSVLPQRPRTVLDLIRTRLVPANGNGNTVGYLRQIARPTGAAAVADGVLKPTGTGTITGVQDHFRIYALLSEVLPLRYITEYNGLVDLLKTQLGQAVLDQLERDVLAGAATGLHGTGTTENIVGILNTSGVQTQAYSATVAGVDPRFETTLKAVTKVQTIGGTDANAIALHPNDWEKIELARLAKNPQNVAEGKTDKTLHNLPVILNMGLPEGKAIAGDFDVLEVEVRDSGRLDTDTGGDKFGKNQFQMRYEGSFALKVGRANAFVVANLTA